MQDIQTYRRNDLVCHALRLAEIPAIIEPTGLSRVNGKRSYGLSLIPWKAGKSIVRDLTVVNTPIITAYIIVENSSQIASAAAEAASLRKESI